MNSWPKSKASRATVKFSVNKYFSSVTNASIHYHATKKFFYNTAPLYNHALKQSNFDFCLHYEQPTAYCNALTRRNRQRDVIWFNPPYSFVRFPDKHFPPSHKLNNIFNRRTTRISYSYTKNLKQGQ